MNRDPPSRPGDSPPLLNVRKEEWPAVGSRSCTFFSLLSGYTSCGGARRDGHPRRYQEPALDVYRHLPRHAGRHAAVYAAAARFPRHVLVPAILRFCDQQPAVLFFAMHLGWAPALVAKAFFVWLSVINYFMVSVFWSFMSDLYESEQTSACSQSSPPAAAWCFHRTADHRALVKRIGIASLFLVSAGLFVCAIFCVRSLLHWAGAHSRGERQRGEAVGGGIFSGLTLAVANPYLLAIAGYILLLRVLGTFFYLEQTQIVSQDHRLLDGADAAFAQLDLAVNALTLLLQVFITGRLVLSLGLATCLVLLPLFGGLGLTTVGLWPTLWVVAAASVVRRATEFAISKPAREVLFTVVTREELQGQERHRHPGLARWRCPVRLGPQRAARAWAPPPRCSLFPAYRPRSPCAIGVGLYLGRAHDRKRPATTPNSQLAPRLGPAMSASVPLPKHSRSAPVPGIAWAGWWLPCCS